MPVCELLCHNAIKYKKIEANCEYANSTLRILSKPLIQLSCCLGLLFWCPGLLSWCVRLALDALGYSLGAFG